MIDFVIASSLSGTLVTLGERAVGVGAVDEGLALFEGPCAGETFLTMGFVEGAGVGVLGAAALEAAALTVGALGLKVFDAETLGVEAMGAEAIEAELGTGFVRVEASCASAFGADGVGAAVGVTEAASADGADGAGGASFDGF